MQYGPGRHSNLGGDRRQEAEAGGNELVVLEQDERGPTRGLDRTLLRNVFAMIAWQASNYILPFVTIPYLSRVLGPLGYGSLGLALALTGYCVLLTDWGFALG